MLGGIYWGILSVQNFVMLRDSNDLYIESYTGAFDLYKKEYYRNTNYRFSLRNGDVIEVPCEYILQQDKLEKMTSDEELTFRYSVFKNPLRQTHDVVSISSVQNTDVLVDEVFMREKQYGAVGLYSVLSLCSFAPILLRRLLAGHGRKSGGRK